VLILNHSDHQITCLIFGPRRYLYPIRILPDQLGFNKVDAMLRTRIPLWYRNYIIILPDVKSISGKRRYIPVAVETPVLMQDMTCLKDTVVYYGRSYGTI